VAGDSGPGWLLNKDSFVEQTCLGGKEVSFVEETLELREREKAFVAETQRLATANQESTHEPSVVEYPLHSVGTTLEKKSKISAGNISRSLPKTLTTNFETVSTELHPSASASVPLNNEQMQYLTQQVLIDTADRRVEADVK
jgi:hypothetical protein